MILRITNEAIFLNPSVSVPIEKTNIPFDQLHFRNRKGFEIFFEGAGYLQNQILTFIPKNLFAEKSNFETQDSPPIIPTKILFGKMEWSELEKHLTFYRKSGLTAILKEELKK